jgi:sugar lactone lactonase YvrE
MKTKRYLPPVCLTALFAVFAIGASVVQARTITTVAGNPRGLYGFAGDGGPAAESLFDTPTSLALDSSGDIFVADRDNHRVRRIGSDGIITTIAGSGVSGYLGDGGPATAARISPLGVAADGKGNVYVSDCEHHVVRRVAPGGTITTFAGTGAFDYAGDGGPATAAKLECPAAMALDSEENLYIADARNRTVRKVAAATGTITTFAGNAGLTSEPSGDGGPATSASFSPFGLAFDGEDNLYIADAWGGNVRKVTPAGIISTFAGTGQSFSSGDGGPAKLASLNYPAGVAADASGDVFIMTNCRVREVDPGGTITTIAGTEDCGLSGDGCAATSGQFINGINGVMNPLVVDQAGNLFFTDYSANNVREISTAEPPASCTSSASASVPPPAAKAKTPPKVQILHAPPSETADQGAMFSFKGVAGGVYECSVDGGSWTSCRSGQDFGPLVPGDHLFQVRETLDGLTGPAATYRWTIDLPRACVLKVARARVFVYTKKHKARLVIHYTAYRPADVTVSYRLVGARGGLALGSASSHFDVAGVFRLPESLGGSEFAKLRGARQFEVHFKISRTPQSCGRYYTKKLTIPQKISGQTVWFQSDSVFAR